MTTYNDRNVHCIAINGNFDDCQKLVKTFFNSKNKEKINLAAVNSINWVRIMGQLVYYFWSYFKVEKKQEKISYVVPTGNFGNVYAGYVCKQMGLPIDKLVVCSNKNDILTRFFENGVMEIKDSVKTLSPSMDIQVSSNFERTLYGYSKDSLCIKKFFENLNKKGKFKVNKKLLDSLRISFSSGRLSDKSTLTTMNKIFSNYNFVVDPHTAVGIAVGRKVLKKNKKRIYLATAHFSKFMETTEQVIKKNLKLPKGVSQLLNKKEKYDILDNDIQTLVHYILSNSSTSRQVGKF